MFVESKNIIHMRGSSKEVLYIPIIQCETQQYTIIIGLKNAHGTAKKLMGKTTRVAVVESA